MLRTTLASSRMLRAGVFGLAAIAAVVLTTNPADARRARHHHRHHHHHEARYSYNPPFASIVVDANSGATLSATNPDSLRHPASLTKMMTLYLLFERLDAGKISLDTEMPVSAHAAAQDPTKLGLRPGQTIRVEDAIKGLVTKSANDAAVVIAEAIGGDEDDFARMMTRKARALGMTRTVYRNASGLPDDDQVTTARDQATLGRALQDRFPRYYRYFATTSFMFRGHIVRGHNHLLGSVDGVDGIKTGYIRSSGFNLVTNLRRGNRHLVGVVMGGRSSGARDATMRTLLAENLDKAATRRTVAAITENNMADANAKVAEDQARSRPRDMVQVDGAVQAASTAREPVALPPERPARLTRSLIAASTAALPPKRARQEPAPLTSGVIATPAIDAIPGSTAPMKPVRVKTVQVRAGSVRLASAGAAPSVPAESGTAAVRDGAPETSGSVMARASMPPQPANFGTGQGILGVLPASSLPASTAQAMARADSALGAQPRAIQHNGAVKPLATHTGWIIQVGALDTESEARERLDAARGRARGMLGKADPFTEPVGKGNKKLYRARFAGLDRDEAEAVCRTLKRSDLPCITIKN
ncbi:MAG: Serine-type D-Ala-D-Ala carboxypeptidase [Nitrobacter sp.]|uniref:serine hydrolase n=1 Tax=Nitrobacter sp. TaxID=29420 RepID=UPI00387DDB27